MLHDRLDSLFADARNTKQRKATIFYSENVKKMDMGIHISFFWASIWRIIFDVGFSWPVCFPCEFSATNFSFNSGPLWFGLAAGFSPKSSRFASAKTAEAEQKSA